MEPSDTQQVTKSPEDTQPTQQRGLTTTDGITATERQKIEDRVNDSLQSLTQPVQHFMKQSGSSDTLEVNPEDHVAVREAINVLQDATAPMERIPENKAILIDQVMTLLGAYPFGMRFDHQAMKYKTKSFVAAVKCLPMWAVKTAVEKRIQTPGKEPDAGTFAAEVRKEVLDFQKKLSILKRVQQTTNGEISHE